MIDARRSELLTELDAILASIDKPIEPPTLEHLSKAVVTKRHLSFLTWDGEAMRASLARLRAHMHVTALCISLGSLVGGGTAWAATGASIAQAAVISGPLVGVLGFWAVMSIHLRKL